MASTFLRREGEVATFSSVHTVMGQPEIQDCKLLGPLGPVAPILVRQDFCMSSHPSQEGLVDAILVWHAGWGRGADTPISPGH
eukprot:8341485-Karenia_brevis.AAC.1